MNRDPTDGGLREIRPTIISKTVRVDWDLALIRWLKRLLKRRK